MVYLDSRKVLAHNLRTLFLYAKEHKDAGPRNAAELEAVSGVSDSATSRYLSASASANLDHLSRIASAYEIEVWQLMYPNLEPANLPVLRQSPTEKELYEILAAGMKLLTPRGAVDGIEEAVPGKGRGSSPHRPPTSKGAPKRHRV